MAPTIGRILIYHIPIGEMDSNNGNADAPAIVVRVWSDTCVNLKVFCDGAFDVWKTSVTEGTDPGEWSWPVGGKEGFKNPEVRPVVDGDKSIVEPFKLHTWRTASDIGHMATDKEALRYTDKPRKACLAQAEYEAEHLPEEQWEHFEPRW